MKARDTAAPDAGGHRKRVHCLLWDFGNTLCDELSLWRVGPEWMEVYRSFDDGLGAAWSLGELDTAGFVAELAKRMPLREAEIRAHLERTELFELFPFTGSFLRARHLPQAIVTVNPAFFSERIAPDLGLDRLVDAIVVSGEEGTVDKGELCQRALRRLGGSFEPAHALLIDDKPSSLEAWSARGGLGYLFTTDEAFRRDAAAGLDALARGGLGSRSRHA